MSDAPKDYLMQEIAGVIVFEIKISKLIAKLKLSHNRGPRYFIRLLKN